MRNEPEELINIQDGGKAKENPVDDSFDKNINSKFQDVRKSEGGGKIVSSSGRVLSEKVLITESQLDAAKAGSKKRVLNPGLESGSFKDSPNQNLE